MSRKPAPQTRRTDASPPRHVSHRHDATERQADRAADIVGRGGSVTGWSFASVPAEAPVHREEEEKKQPPPAPETPAKLEDKPKSQSESYAEAGGKVVEGVLKTKAGQQVQDRVTSSKPLTGAIGVGLLAAGKEVPIPLGKGVTLGVKVDGLTEGKVNSAGVTLTFGGGTPKKTTARPVIDRDSEKLMESIRAQTEGNGRQAPTIRPLWVPESVQKLPPPAPSGAGWRFNPLVPGTSMPVAPPQPQPAQPAEVEKEDEVKRAPATTSEAPSGQEYDTSGVPAATRGGGRALDPALRHSMEARFGYDFSSVRLHDDPQAASAAAGVHAAAFTVGEHIVFGSGRFDPSSPEGRRLLAHELAHVVQDRGARTRRTTGAPTRIHRLDVGNWFSLLFGGEGTWTDQELEAYLLKITAAGAHEGWWESDNKARAVVRKFMAGSVGWDLLARQKALLVDEMLDGAVLDQDEEGILNLLETAAPTDLAAIFRDPKARFTALDKAFDGAEHDRLLAFVSRRFARGSAGLLAGDAEVVGDAIPHGAPAFGFDPRVLDLRFDGDYSSAEISEMIDRLSPADHGRVRDHLLKVLWPAVSDELGSVVRTYVGLADSDTRKPVLAARIGALHTRRRKIKEVLSRLLLELVPKIPKDAESLREESTAVPRRERDEVERLLAPKTYPVLIDDVIELDAPSSEPKTEAPAAAPTAPTAPDVAPAPKTAAQKKADAARKAEEARKRAADEEKRFGPKSDYRKELQALTAKVIDDFYQARHVNVGKRGTKSDLEPMVPHAITAADAVFGHLLPADKKRKAGDPPPVTFGTDKKPGNLHLQYDYAHDKWRRMDALTRRKEAMWWIKYFHRANERLLAFHSSKDAHADWGPGDAAQNAVARTIVEIAAALTVDGASEKGYENPTTTVDKVLAAWRGWPGIAIGSQVYLALYEGSSVEETRRLRWSMFKTVIHEYMHTLAHKEFDAYALSFGNSSAHYTTLIEGVDDVFTGMVWQHVRPSMTTDADLRKAVEGEPYWKLPPLTPIDPGNYPAHTEAMRLVAEVGLKNVMAAYFLGLVDRLPLPKDYKMGPKK